MKAIFSGLMITVSSASAFSATRFLLSCNPPMGSHLQEVKITQDSDGKIYRAELNMYGSLSERTEISAASWAKKDLVWKSRNVGVAHLFILKREGKYYWGYQSKDIGSSVQGYCEVN